MKLPFRRRPSPFRDFSVPEGMRIYAIGDVHGCLAQLDELLARIAADEAERATTAETRIIFLGDLVDRGPDSASGS